MTWACPTPDPDAAPSLWGDLLVLAATILGEAEGEPYDGKLAVAFVVMNRYDAHRFGATVTDICLAHLQFSAWNHDSPRITSMYFPKKYVKESIWTDCFRAACAAYFSFLDSPVGTATHYAAEGTNPSWAEGRQPDYVVGNQNFWLNVA